MTIFISRAQTKSSSFKKILEGAGHQVIGQSLIHFNIIPIEDFPASDWIFFYSQKGVQFLFQQIDTTQLRGKKIACLGAAAARALSVYGVNPHFIGNGNPTSVAIQFLHEAKGTNVLFIQALHSRQSVQKILGSEIQSISRAVYINEILKDFDIPYCDVLAFTSPLNVNAYYTKYPPLEQQQVVAIGHTTEKALQSKGIHKVMIAKKAGEEAMARAVLSCII